MGLECRHLNYFYPGTAQPVLADLSLSLDAPGMYALFGHSGVGKTSLAKVLAGMLPPASGKILTDSLETTLYSHNLERLPGWSSVGRHLERITPDHNRALMERFVETFGLRAYLGQRFTQLSLGQRNRINLLRYLVQDFQMLIMDESLANVDELTRATILATIKEAFPQAYFLYISHNVVEVARFCRQIWVLRDQAKRPQAVAVSGRNQRDLQMAGTQVLEKTILELMNAA